MSSEWSIELQDARLESVRAVLDATFEHDEDNLWVDGKTEVEAIEIDNEVIVSFFGETEEGGEVTARRTFASWATTLSYPMELVSSLCEPIAHANFPKVA